jgi:hypothetical protein
LGLFRQEVGRDSLAGRLILRPVKAHANWRERDASDSRVSKINEKNQVLIIEIGGNMSAFAQSRKG